jgi:hypothetical protein
VTASSRQTNGALLPALGEGLTRLDPYDGLVVDAGTWTAAHGYHEAVDRIHGLAAHGPGVLVGLEVVPAGGKTVGVLPGVGLAVDGSVLVLPKPVQASLTAGGGGTVLVILRRADEEPDDEGRVREGCEVQATTTLPDEPHLELARVALGSASEVRHPGDPRRPNPDELDLRFRLVAGGHARGLIEVADLAVGAGGGHTGGGALFARAVSRDSAYHARYVGEVKPGSQLSSGSILYISGDADFSLNEGSTSWLRSFLDSGGTVVGDGCHATAADPFGAAFDRLAKAAGRQLRRVVDGDRMLWSHHAFGAPPPGAVKTDIGLVLAGDGMIYCASDYGCVLRGARDNPFPRSAIHAVEEFCTNLVALARERSLPQTSAG